MIYLRVIVIAPSITAIYTTTRTIFTLNVHMYVHIYILYCMPFYAFVGKQTRKTELNLAIYLLYFFRRINRYPKKQFNTRDFRYFNIYIYVHIYVGVVVIVINNK